MFQPILNKQKPRNISFKKIKNKLVVLLRFSAEQAENVLKKNYFYSNIKITFMKLKSDANQQFFTDDHF